MTSRVLSVSFAWSMLLTFDCECRLGFVVCVAIFDEGSVFWFFSFVAASFFA